MRQPEGEEPRLGVSQPSFWETAYREGRTGWDLGGPTPPFVYLLRGPQPPPPGRMLVVGAGRGHDALLFAQAGSDVTALDFAPAAVTEMTRLVRQTGVKMEVIEADVFDIGQRWPEGFDYVLEHTCFCAIDPARRLEYVAAVHAVLRPGGELIALFYAHGRAGGPPFATTEAEIRRLFEPGFVVEELAMTSHSTASRRGEEMLGRLRRR